MKAEEAVDGNDIEADAKRVLVVGSGSIGERHIRCTQALGRVDVALCELDERRGAVVAERYKIQSYNDYTNALDAGFDAVIICTPAPLHIEMARQAVDRGCHVLIEKPLSTTVDGIEHLESEAKRSGVVIAVAYVWRMHPVLQKAKQLLDSGVIGQPLQLVAQCGQDFAHLRAGYEKTYYARHEMGGGAVQDGLTHVANAVELLCGPTESVMCEADHLSIPRVEVEDVVGVIARNGKVVVVYAFNQAQNLNEFLITLHGTEGSLCLDLVAKKLDVFKDGLRHTEEFQYKDHDVLFKAQASSFLDAIERGGALPCSLHEGIQTLKFNLACLQSAREGRRVAL